MRAIRTYARRVWDRVRRRRRGSSAPVPNLLIAPYLPLKNRVTVGPWELVPFRDLDGADVVPNELERPVARLIEAYRVPGTGGGGALGAVIFPEGAGVGEPFERSDMHPLGHALVAG